MKKWITKAEINKILKTYALQKDEFLPVVEKDYFYQSQMIKGYTITISEELEQAANYSEKTGRIIVSHTQWNGRKTYTDIWERTKSGTLQFKFRNLQNQPISDIAYIQDLERQLKEAIETGRNLQEQLKAIKNNDTITEEQKLISDSKIEKLQEQIDTLKQENQKLKNKTKYNSRNAGRKPSKERLNAIAEVKTLIQEGFTDSDIITKIGISKATFYRYKKEIINN